MWGYWLTQSICHGTCYSAFCRQGNSFSLLLLWAWCTEETFLRINITNLFQTVATFCYFSVIVLIYYWSVCPLLSPTCMFPHYFNSTCPFPTAHTGHFSLSCKSSAWNVWADILSKCKEAKCKDFNVTSKYYSLVTLIISQFNLKTNLACFMFCNICIWFCPVIWLDKWCKNIK